MRVVGVDAQFGHDYLGVGHFTQVRSFVVNANPMTNLVNNIRIISVFTIISSVSLIAI